MEIKRLTFKINCVNRVFEMSEHSDKSELYLNGMLCSSSDYLARKADEPIYIRYYGKTYNISELFTLISVKNRPPRSEASGIACTEPWKSNDELRDHIRIDGLSESYIHINVGIFVPPELYERLYSTNFNTCQLFIDTQFFNTGENYLKVDNPENFLFAYLSEVSVRMISMSEQKKDT